MTVVIRSPAKILHKLVDASFLPFESRLVRKLYFDLGTFRTLFVNFRKKKPSSANMKADKFVLFMV